ncbi:MAG: CPBP family intramembrane glutamic endopeptidase [Terracidiphilus sp.]|jgi:membrane protease YdiL (CAAX protease family)
MSDLEHTPDEPEFDPLAARDQALPDAPEPALSLSKELASETVDSTPPAEEPAELFQSWSRPEAVPPTRIPHLGHLCLLIPLGLIGLFCASVLLMIALRFHLFGVATMDDAVKEVHYILGSEAIIYLVTFALSIVIYPLFWNKGFFAGIQWRGAAALRLGWRIPALSLGCCSLALLDEIFLPGPEHAPIDDIFRTPGAAWLLFAFGVTLAPFFEEIFFRGFLLPALATAWDWASERFTGKRPSPLDANGHPQWSIQAMVIASIATSLPFALMHAEQTGHSFGPFLLLIAVSLILCVVRLKTRSLAASTMVHACYNFMIFSFMMIGTGGFRHLDKM